MSFINDEELSKEIEFQRNSLTTDRLDMSYGELINLYEKDEIIIDPNFQRLFRWDIERRSRFIESILLGIPVPPIFVAEDENGAWELVDGLQRISTILSFFGKLKNDNKENNNWRLESGTLISKMEGYTGNDLPIRYQRNIQRTYCRVEIIKWDSQYDMRYELFNRLNTGGASLTQQEIRNCIYRGTSEEFNELLEELSERTIFKELIQLTDRQLETLYHQELVLRFFSLYFTELEEINSKNMSLFMTNFMKNTIKDRDFDYSEAKTIFIETFNFLGQLDSSIFRFSNNQFSTSLYDAITISIAKKLEQFKSVDAKSINEWIGELKVNDDFRKYVGSAASSKSRVVNRMEAAFSFLERSWMEIFNEAVEEDILYRKSELALLKKNCYMSSITNNRLDIIIKYTPVAIYSVFEGYFVSIMESFIDYINRQSYERMELKDSILSRELEVKCDAFTVRNNKKKRIDHLNNLETFFSNGKLMLSKELDTKSNVNLKVVNDVFEVYGIQRINNREIEGKLNKLLKFRNSIAHGEYSIKVTLKDINEFVQCIDIAIDLIYDNILIGFNERCYLK